VLITPDNQPNWQILFGSVKKHMANIALAKTSSYLRRGWNTETASWGGTIGKTLLLFGVLIVSAAIGWIVGGKLGSGVALASAGICAIAAFAIALMTIFKPERAEWLAPGYAIFEGYTLGVVSMIYAAKYYGIIPVAVFCTIVTVGVCIALWGTKTIRVTDKFISTVICATGAVVVLYLVDLIFIAIGSPLPFLHGHGVVPAIVSVVICIIAAANVLIDLEVIDRSVACGSPKAYEWYFGFSLMVTIVWLYLELLRLISILSSDD
jgi:uncharacterized YccA/Bax inhibitor family protein